MNYFIISKLLGLLLLSLSATMLPSLCLSVLYHDGAQNAFIGAITVSALIGALLFGIGSLRHQELYRREATAMVGLGWFLSALAGALPFYFADAFPTFIDCYFESMSGFTTTGSSVLQNFDALPRSLHFWRCFTHFLGGMGIIVLFVALLPFLGGSGRSLLRSEVPGPVTETFTPHVKDTAVLLWKIYCSFVIAETLILMFCGMGPFDAICHSFATLATGGFSTNGASIAGFNSVAVELTILFFMIAAGSNFSLFYIILRGNRRALLQDPEWRVYLGIIVCSTLAIAAMLVYHNTVDSIFTALRQSAFQVVSLMTTTGFATANFDQWPPATKSILVTLMFLGGCAGSTGGGIKIIRWVTLMKIGRQQIEQVYSPRTVRKLRMGNMVIEDRLQTSILSFFFLWMFIIFIGILAVALIEGPVRASEGSAGVKLITIVTSVITTLNNIGPGLGNVGPEENFAFFKPATKVLLTFFMVLGRLELYTILVLFVPKFWRQY